ncbi:MAG: BON domain-containing protein [Ramlibacter sp.]
MKSLFVPLGLAFALTVTAQAQERRNWFDDPFLPVTSALPGCPVPVPPGMTDEEVRAAGHVRAQHGTSCYRVGRCRLSNSYLYDKEIIPRVAQYIRMDGRFDDTSVWVQGERRLVFLMGCVRTQQQANDMEATVILVDDVMGVINYLQVGAQAEPRYRVEK